MIRPTLLSLLLCLSSGVTAFGGRIHWGTAVFDSVFDASGSPFTGQEFHWMMGTFNTGGVLSNDFNPTALNTAEWLNHWRIVEESNYVMPNTITEASDFAANPDTVTGGIIWQRDEFDPPLPDSNPHVFRPGDQFYLWVYNSTDASSPSSEWALVTGNWVLPANITDPTNQSGNDFYLSNATTVIYGGLNNVDGPGQNAPVGGSFSLQTAFVPVPVPEPRIGALVLLIAVLKLRRSRVP